jgi:hypothetical protein
MQAPPRPTPRESTEAMVRNIGRELVEIEQAIGRSRGDLVAAQPPDRHGQKTSADQRSGVTGRVQRR